MKSSITITVCDSCGQSSEFSGGTYALSFMKDERDMTNKWYQLGQGDLCEECFMLFLDAIRPFLPDGTAVTLWEQARTKVQS